MHPLSSVLGAIGNTPIVALDRLREAVRVKPRIFAKLEYYSPGGSIKDRSALKIIEDAERKRELEPGKRVVELTSGNMGIGLAVVCGIKGYPFTAVMSKGNSPERWRILRALGADVELVPQAKGGVPGKVTKEDLELVERRTQKLVRRLSAFRPDQFNNPKNPLAHEQGTGEEIWKGLEGRVDYFVAMVGTGGTFIGSSRALKKRNPRIKCYAVEPANAPVLAGGRVKSTKHKIQGTGYAFIPPQWDSNLCDGYLAVSDREAISTARLLAKKEGILAGFSGGANVAAATKLARKIGGAKVIATVIPDTGLKYLSTDLFQ